MPTLQYGSRGLMVRYLQLALTRAGFDPGVIDGIFGRRTERAVRQLQRQEGLVQDGIVGTLTWAAVFPYLAGYRVEETGEGERVVPLPFTLVPFEVPYSNFLVQVLLDGLVARYPFLTLSTIGSSVMGRRIRALTMGEGGRTAMYNAAHHANEWITVPLLLRFVEDYARAVATGAPLGGADMGPVYRNTRLVAVPLVDPDGVDLVTGALPATDSYYMQARALAAYYPGIPFPEGWKANIRGVDLNLGYPAGWEQARRIKFAQGYTRPGPRDYVGTAPLSEPENIAMAELTRQNAFQLTLSYHTQGGVIYWRYLNYDPPRAREIADLFAGVSGYLVEETPYSSGFAGYKDWFIQEYDLPGYTIEAGRGVNPLPLSELPGMYRENLGIFIAGLQVV